MLLSEAVADAPARAGLQVARDALARGFVRTRAGQIGAALADLEPVWSDPGLELGDLERAALATTLVECRLARGELAEAHAIGDQLGRHLEQPGLVGATAHYGRGELSAATGDADLAGAHFARIARLVSGADDDPELLPWRTGAALAAVRLGHRAEGAALAREHLEAARAVDSPFATALGLRTLATVDPHADHVALLREARGLLDGVPAARLAAQIDTDLAGLLLLSGGPETAAEGLALLRGAEAYAGEEELWPLQGRVRRLLARMDQAPRPVRGEAVAALTSSERKVARLAADGLTNREIARQLLVTVKAVEWHLSHVYRKLGIRSRSGLAPALGRE